MICVDEPHFKSQHVEYECNSSIRLSQNVRFQPATVPNERRIHTESAFLLCHVVSSQGHRIRVNRRTFGMSDLFVINRADIFAVYPRIFKAILITDEKAHTRDGSLSRDTILLPTNSDYQDRVYTRLLTIQKAVNDAINSGLYVDHH